MYRARSGTVYNSPYSRMLLAALGYLTFKAVYAVSRYVPVDVSKFRCTGTTFLKI
eukprot:SAG31_NODE_300_length_18109_cov_47.887285_19_plen_55_part_00